MCIHKCLEAPPAVARDGEAAFLMNSDPVVQREDTSLRYSAGREGRGTRAVMIPVSVFGPPDHSTFMRLSKSNSHAIHVPAFCSIT